MKTLVIDANEIARDFMCVSLRYQLIEHLGPNHWMQVFVPAVVIEESVANYVRALANSKPADKGRLGLHATAPLTGEEYREYLTERFDTRLGFDVLPWPDIPHADVVHRAVNRIPPFNSNGGGYRDTLIWSDVSRLAREGRDVVLVSRDKAFTGPSGALADALAEEVAEATGSVELISDLGSWVLAAMPQASSDLVQSVVDAQDQEFHEYLLASGALSDMAPQIVDLGFERSPWHVALHDVQWLGTFCRTSTARTPNAQSVAVYELEFNVDISAFFTPLNVREGEWVTKRIDEPGLVIQQGEIAMGLRITVQFGGDFSFSIEDEVWRRLDGTGSGEDIYRPELDDTQPSLFDF